MNDDTKILIGADSSDKLLNELDLTTEIFNIQKYIKHNQEEHLRSFLSIKPTTTSEHIPKLTRCDTYCGPKLDHSLDELPIHIEYHVSTIEPCVSVDKIKN